jgi:tripartite-type tricarboxylate transporter receptor subunit TctC
MRVPPVLHKAVLAKALVLLAVAAMLGGAPRPAAAEDWPTRPVTLVMTFAPGTLFDAVGRALAIELSGAIGQPVVNEVRAGAGGAVGSAYVAKMPADGYTLLMSAVGPMVLRPLIDKTVGYADSNFTPIILIGESPNVLAASPKLGVSTVKDFLAYAKTKDNKISLGHAGPGTMGHLCSVMFANLTGLDASSISYRGVAMIVTDLLGGQIDAAFPNYSPPTKSASILAVTSEERVDFLPGVPTLKESGFDVVGTTWFAIYGPANMPPEIVAKINSVMDAYLKKPENRARFGEQGFRLLGGPPARLSERAAKDRATWAPIMAGLNLGVDK